MIYGTDVSDYQANWTPTTEDFVFIKATEGQSFVANSVKTLTARARQSNLVVGFYHFLWPSSHSGSPEVQARWFVDHCGALDGDLLVCDWESVNVQRGQPRVRPTVADYERFIREVKRLRPHCKVGVYCNQSDWASSNKYAGDFLWIAAYGNLSPSLTAWTFHQYQGTPIDLDLAKFNTRGELRAWSRALIPVPKPPTPPKDTDMATWKDWSETEKKDMADRVATAILNKDGLIENILGADRATNKTITTKSAFAAIMKKLR